MIRLVALLLLALVALAPTDSKASCSGTGCYCSVSATTLAFGAYDGLLRTAVDSAGSVAVTCGADAGGTRISYEVTLSTGSSGNYTSRAMSGAVSNLTYNLYTKSNRKDVWGDGTGGSTTVTDSYRLGTPCCVTQSYPIYGRIDASQNAAPGIYADTIVATVSW